MKGRPPTPSEILKARGTYREDRHGDRAEVPASKPPTCPNWLDKDAKAEWQRRLKDLKPMGILSPQDQQLLAAYCQAVSDLARAQKALSKSGDVVKGSTGNLVLNPFHKLKNQAIETITKIASHFGFSPASRCKLKKPSEEKPQTDKSRFFFEPKVN